MRCMEGRKGHFQFHTFTWTFVYQRHLTMHGMGTLSNLPNNKTGLRRKEINYDHDGQVFISLIDVYPCILHMVVMVRFLEVQPFCFKRNHNG